MGKGSQARQPSIVIAGGIGQASRFDRLDLQMESCRKDLQNAGLHLQSPVSDGKRSHVKFCGLLSFWVALTGCSLGRIARLPWHTPDSRGASQSSWSPQDQPASNAFAERELMSVKSLAAVRRGGKHGHLPANGFESILDDQSSRGMGYM